MSFGASSSPNSTSFGGILYTTSLIETDGTLKTFAVNCAASSVASAPITILPSTLSLTATAYVTNAWCSWFSSAGTFEPHIAATVWKCSSSCVSLLGLIFSIIPENRDSLVKPCTLNASDTHEWFPRWRFTAGPCAGTVTVPLAKQSMKSLGTSRSAAKAAHTPSTPTASRACAGIASAASVTNRERTYATCCSVTCVFPCARVASTTAGNNRSCRER